MDKHTVALATEFGQNEQHIEHIIQLLDEGNTIPFIARYRKEMHGAMDDQLIREIADRLSYLRNLAQRCEEIEKAIANQGKLTEELKAALLSAKTYAELEDLYRPYKQKRRTRATVAKEKGLEPLAFAILAQGNVTADLPKLAQPFLSAEKEVSSIADALSGAGDIIAEIVADDAKVRQKIKALADRKALLCSKATGEEDSVYRLYYDFAEPIRKIPGYRVLAINRGEKEKYLKVSIQLESLEALGALSALYIKKNSPCEDFLVSVLEDAYTRLIFPSIERELRSDLTAAASEQAIKMFALNLKPLLMQPPVKNRVTMGFDPAYRTGCKIAVVDETGQVLATAVVYPTPPHNQKEKAKATLAKLIEQYHITAIAVGNATASKESEIFVAELLQDFSGVEYMMVSEAGASVYSASKLAAAEFPQYDVSLRSAISIARRLQDPLAELVKIDPKAIGIGQYQHDMPLARLDAALNGVVEDCVNAVGVDINTASPALLAKVAGLNQTTAANIVAYRNENGPFHRRKELLKVAKIGPKAYEQCAGFLRVPESDLFLDRTGVHPESYSIAEQLLALCGYSIAEAENNSIPDLRCRLAKIPKNVLTEKCAAGLPTIEDIVTELMKPGRDPRTELPPTMLRKDVMDLQDLAPGMRIKGTVRNVVDFGVFVDIGVHQDGLVHISELSQQFVRHPAEILQVGDIVDTVVLNVDVEKKRIALSIKQAIGTKHE